MHKSSFQSMEKFKNNYLNTEDSLNILDIGSYDASDTSYNYGRFLREDNWKYRGMDIQEGPNVDIVVQIFIIGLKLKIVLLMLLFLVRLLNIWNSFGKL